jgi:signal transduction histidine kinase/CheY-like chemotaxis protein/HPt (histidine-containing phosphotransfer) domain-containing protein
MTQDSHLNVPAIARRTVTVLVVVPLVLAVTTIIGWLFDVPLMKNPFPNQPPVAPSTALCFLLVGAILLSRGWTAVSDTVVKVAAAVGLLIASLIALHYLFGSLPDLDQWLSTVELRDHGFAPGRMAPNTAIAFILAFAALLCREKMRWLGNALLAGLTILAGSSLLGYLYGQPHLYGLGRSTPMALPTAWALVFTACAIFVSRRDAALMRVLLSNGEAGYSARRLILAAIVLPVLLGYLRLTGERLGLFSSELGVAMMVVATIVLFCLIIFSVARFIEEFSTEREKSLDMIRGLNTDLESMRDKALEAVRIKSEFLANMSHEIRTPMNAVIGCADILKRTRLDSEQARLVDIINTSGDALLGLISDILLLSKIEAGKYESEIIAFDVKESVHECARMFQQKVTEKGIALRVILPDDAQTIFFGDPQAFRQVLTNLLSNAIKFTKHGSVTVTTEITRYDGTGDIQVAVTDTGIGIQTAHIEKLFNAFEQADGSITREFGGTGLGLAITKRLVELMHGNIRVESTPGIGSTFSFRLVLRAATAADLRAESPRLRKEQLVAIDDFTAGLPADANKFVLLVEDNLVNQEVARYELQTLGFSCVVCNNGKEALEMLEKRRFPLVLMDCQMPVMDGYEATRLLRESEKRKNIKMRTPIIAMTANAMEGDAEKCLRAGMDDYISKPVTVEMLKAAIEKWFLVGLDLDDGDSERPVAPQATPPASHSPELQSLLAPIQENFGAEGALRLVQMFIQQTPDMLLNIESAIDRRDSNTIALTAHGLRGSASALGFNDISDATKTIELNSDDYIVCTNELAKVREYFAHMRRLLDGLIDCSNIPSLTRKTKVIIVEDNTVTREALSCIVEQVDDFEIIGEAGDGTTAIDLISGKAPDVVLFDIELPGMSGIDALANVKSTYPSIKALMLTAHDDDAKLFNAFDAGADGYLLKHSFNKRNLELAMRTVLSGNCWLDPELAKRVLNVASKLKQSSPTSLHILSDEDELALTRIADADTTTCGNGVCSIDSAFLKRLKRLQTN